MNKLNGSLFLIIFFLMWETSMFPIINKPGTVLEWWQVKELALAGEIVGLPFRLVYYRLLAGGYLNGLNGLFWQIIYWGCVALWSTFEAYVLALCISKVSKFINSNKFKPGLR